jgi:1-acyl-sn-glycerol-3-phosphate acyltransferase
MTNPGFYNFAKNTVRLIGTVLWRLHVLGTNNVPMTGPLIVACNHVSNLDPPLMGCMCPRQISDMAKRELFEMPVLGPLIGALGSYPVDREGSATAAIKRSLEVLRAGGCVGLFPEGGRNVEGDKVPRAGVALLASLARAPVVPACIVGSAQARRLSRITVAFGTPLTLPRNRKATKEELTAFTEEVMQTIHALARQSGADA